MAARRPDPGREVRVKADPGFGLSRVIEVEDWRERFPWLVQGVTLRDASGSDFDFGLSGEGSLGVGLRRWTGLRDLVGMDTVVVSRQVHGATVRSHRISSPGFLLAPDCDGHITGAAGLLVAVTVADCVPVFLVTPESRVVALLHAGWRGIAAGVLEAGIDAFEDRFGVHPSELWVHLGPSVCGDCYEVGPEVHAALGLPESRRPGLLDLRGHLAERAEAAGVRSERLGVSAYCTMEDGGFFSHRGGDPGRQVAYLGVRPLAAR